MDFTEDAFVLSARAHGDTGVVVDLLTEGQGRRAAYVAGGASRKMKPFLQPGARVRDGRHPAAVDGRAPVQPAAAEDPGPDLPGPRAGAAAVHNPALAFAPSPSPFSARVAMDTKTSPLALLQDLQAQGQQRGHWDTTPANALAQLALSGFAARFEKDAVSGRTTIALGAARQVAS